MCHGVKKTKNMSDVREETWSQKMGKAKVTTVPELKTTETYTQLFEC